MIASDQLAAEAVLEATPATMTNAVGALRDAITASNRATTMPATADHDTDHN